MALRRAKELGPNVETKSCGLGEATLHRHLASCIRLATDEGFNYSLTTNGSPLTRKLSRQLVDAGLNTLFMSASGIGQVCETIHRLEFATVSRNIRQFADISSGQCRAVIAVTLCDSNRSRTEELFHYWRRGRNKGFRGLAGWVEVRHG